MPAGQGLAGAPGALRRVSRILILRPEPGASETATRASGLGLDPVLAPLFIIRPLPWQLPDDPCDALLLTSANAARHAGRLPDLPCYVVGEATAQAARAAGCRDPIVGPSDGVAALAMAAEDGRQRILHLCGRDHLAIAEPRITLVRRAVYAADAVATLPAAAGAALAQGAIALLHSPRAAALFADLAGDRSQIRLITISAAAAHSAGSGWSAVRVAAEPRDQALLELAAELCKAAAAEETGRDR